MRIAIDATPAQGEGGRDYARAIIAYMRHVCPEHMLFVALSESQYKEFKSIQGNVESCVVKEKKGFERMFWQQTFLAKLLRKWNVGVVYTLSSFDILTAPCPTVIKIANMLPFDEFALTKEINDRGRLLWLKWLGKLSARTADATVVMSETAREELVRKHGFPAARSFGIVHSADVEELEGYDAAQEVARKIGDNFILSVSHIYRYKNLHELMRGYHLAMQKGVLLPGLVIAGDEMDKEYSRELKSYVGASNLNDRVLFFGKVPRNGLGSLYRACRFLVFSSLVETCPRTLIEALKCGTAVMCSNRSVMPEIGGNAPLYFDPNDVNDICEKILRLSQDDDLIASLRGRSLREGKRFDWEITARKTLDVLISAAERRIR